MAYTLVEQQSKDLDIFFRDKKKLIHIASGGGQIPKQLAENDTENEKFKSEVFNLNQSFEIEISQNLRELLNLDENGYTNYISDFVDMAKRGYYSYDKTKIGDFESPTFHLVAKPKDPDERMYLNADKLLKIDEELPDNFESFDLFSYFKEK